MLNLLRSIIEFITAIVSFIIHAIGSLLNFITLIPTYVSFLITSINVLPSVFIPFMIATITLSVVLFVLNRRASK